MGRCETCGNEYDKAFQVTVSGRAHTFDSFECAIHMRRNQPWRLESEQVTRILFPHLSPCSPPCSSCVIF